jgi:hypothetical protein
LGLTAGPKAYLAAAGRSEAVGATTQIAFLDATRTVDPHYAKPPAVVAGPQDPVKPPNTLKIAKPPIAIGDLYFQNLA